MIVWRIAAATRAYLAEDLTGAGAAITGGRWNPIGLPIVYCSTTLSLACLETLVHVNLAGPMPENRFRIRVSIPDEVWAVRRNARDDPAFPSDWRATPAPRACAKFGAAWASAARETVLIVPSVALPQEDNVLLNPRHTGFRGIRAVNEGRLEYDPRLFPGTR